MEQRPLSRFDLERFCLFCQHWPAGHIEAVLGLSSNEIETIRKHGLGYFLHETKRSQTLHPIVRLATMMYPSPSDDNLQSVNSALTEYFQKMLHDKTFSSRDLMLAIDSDPIKVAQMIMQEIIQSNV